MVTLNTLADAGWGRSHNNRASLHDLVLLVVGAGLAPWKLAGAAATTRFGVTEDRPRMRLEKYSVHDWSGVMIL